MPEPEFRLDPQSLTRVIPVNTMLKGLTLYHGQRVRALAVARLDHMTWEIEGQVQGTQREAYAQHVQVVMNAEHQLLQWTARCTCPVAVDCKHAAALTLKAAFRASATPGAPAASSAPAAPLDPEAVLRATAESERRLADEKLARWLNDFSDAGNVDSADRADRAMAPADEAERQDRYIYLLVAESTGGRRRLALRVAVSRPRVQGGWTKARKAPTLFYAGLPLYDRASAIDHDLLNLVKGLAGAHRYSAYSDQLQGALEGQPGALALGLAAQSGRLFALDARNNPTPIALGEPQPLHWQWTAGPAAAGAAPTWTLTHQLADPQAEVFANAPPLYLDMAQHLCGPVHTPGVPAAHLAQLLAAPPMSQEAIARHEDSLLRRLAGVPLPPAIQAPRVIEPQPPIAHLHLRAMAEKDVPVFGLLEGALQFDYGGMRGYWSDEQVAMVQPDPQRPTGRVQFQRDIEAEVACIRKLAALGLSGNSHGRVFLRGERNQTPWLQWIDADWAPLREAGFQVTQDPALADFLLHAGTLDVSLAPPAGASADEDSDAASPWFNLSLGLEIQGVRHNILPWLPDLLAQLQPTAADLAGGTADDAGDSTPALPPFIFLRQPDGRFLRIPTDTLRPWIGALLDLMGDRTHDFDQATLRLSRLEALRLGSALGDEVPWRGAQALQEMVRQLQGHSALPVVPLPPTLAATLRPYQHAGLNWLQFLRQHGLAGILADDMGLGKTVQTLAHIQVEKDAGRLTAPALIVAPVSLMGNWQREAQRFCPGLRTLVLHGQERHGAAERMGEHDIVIAPYSLLHRDRERWLQAQWHLVVLDEAQNIKNASTNAAQVASQLNTRHRLCLSGTPMENHLGELWSLFHFLMPGFLGNATRFKKLFRTPIEKHGDSERLAQLRRRVTPFMLRRTKDLVATELPPKVETTMRAELQGKQADLYETIRLTTEKAVREALAEQGLAKSQITVLDALLKLRQVCCDPRLVPLPAAQKIKQSAKLEQLMELLPEMLAEGRRVLLFSQFTSMLELIEAELKARELRWVKLTGQSQKRDALIERFTSGEVPLFLISLKAGGVGLNLPQADTVIHYDPWWNPAVETQATDRAHRIGQTKSVWVVKLVAQGTIEERILGLQERKAALAESMYSGAQGRKQPLFTEDDLQELLKPLGA